VSQASIANPVAPLQALAPPPPSERELTFAWGYAQRHPEAPARQAEARPAPALAGARAQAVAIVPKREARRVAERQRAAVAQRQSVGVPSSGFFLGFNGDPHQALGFAEERRANRLPAISRVQSTYPRHHGPSQQPQT
jgi:hypothetical protein